MYPPPNPPAPLSAAALTLSVLALGCASSTPQEIAASQRFEDQIRWPPEYTPGESSFFIHNEVAIAASPKTVWNVLIQAETWPEWYEGASDVVVDAADGQPKDGLLREDAVFTWTTMGLDFVSTVKEFEPHRRLSWESEKAVITGYHAWLIIPTAQGCILVTDESQNGFLTLLEKIFQPNKLRRLHDVWLAEIKRKAEATEPTTARATP